MAMVMVVVVVVVVLTLVVVKVLACSGCSEATHRLANLFLVLGAPVLEPHLNPRGVQVSLDCERLAETRRWVAVLLEGFLKQAQLILVECGSVSLWVHDALCGQ